MNKIIRFLEPMKHTPYLYIRSILIFFWWWLNWVVHILFLQRLTHFLEIWNRVDFNQTIIYYIFFIVIFDIVFFSTGRYWWTDTYNQSVINIQKKYLREFVELDNNKIEWIWTWKMVAIIKWWIEMWWKLIMMLIENLSQIFIVLMFTLYMLFKINNLYWIIFIIIYILFHFTSGFFNKKVIEIRKKRIETRSIHTKHFVRILMSKFEILQSNKIENEIKRLDEFQRKEIAYNQEMSFTMNLIFRIPEWWMDLILLFVFIYFWSQVFSGTMDLSVFVWISGMLILMKNAITRSIEIYKNFTKDFAEVDKLWELYDNTDKIAWYENGFDYEYKTGDIKLQNISFAYNESTNHVFDDFSLDIKWWKLTALVWASWSWKTTIVKLISWYIKANSWKIIVDWQDLDDVSLKSYYKSIWYLTQEPSVFDWSIIDNLTYAIEWKVSKKQINEIIKLSKCEFIYDFKDWINTQIWERGIKLSWWQKQRLAIAKIMLKNPKIIILDEPTSALDSFSEELITKAMNNLFANRTVIVIAHRLQTVKHADDIIVLENGKIQERWTHKQLIKHKWVYKQMLDLQSGF